MTLYEQIFASFFANQQQQLADDSDISMDVVPVDQIPAEGGEDAISAEHDALAEPLNNDPSHYSGKSYNHFVVTSFGGKLNIYLQITKSVQGHA